MLGTLSPHERLLHYLRSWQKMGFSLEIFTAGSKIREPTGRSPVGGWKPVLTFAEDVHWLSFLGFIRHIADMSLLPDHMRLLLLQPALVRAQKCSTESKPGP